MLHLGICQMDWKQMVLALALGGDVVASELEDTPLWGKVKTLYYYAIDEKTYKFVG